MAKKLIKIILIIVGLFALYFITILTFSTLTKWNPETFIKLDTDGKASSTSVPDTFSILIWNIGYCGLGKEMDFFNDGGKSVRASQEQSEIYLTEIRNYISTLSEHVEFLLLQEVDRNSKRSYHIDQYEAISNDLNGFESVFALNYDVKFVPVPFQIPYKPYGKTFGGLMSLSQFSSTSSLRVQYPGGFSWPTSLYMLNRCALEQTYNLSIGKKLMIVNTHNTAYDETGEIKKTEMEFMRNRYDSLTNAGYHIIIGGDWNQIPPDFDPKKFSTNLVSGYTPHGIESSMIPENWKVIYDDQNPTNRSNETPFLAGRNYTTLIDFFMVSPDVSVLDIKTLKLDFKYSDHEPVLLKVCIHKSGE